MREARRTRDGRWFLVDGGSKVPRVLPLDWHPDADGHWPRVDFEVRGMGERVECPNCGTSWSFEPMDCIFGIACRGGNDALALVRCAACRLPHRVRAIGFVTAYPQIVSLMEGWASWEQRRTEFEAEEGRLYGVEEGGAGG